MKRKFVSSALAIFLSMLTITAFISPSVYGWRVVLPSSYVKVSGTYISGNLYSFYYVAGDFYKLRGAGFIIYQQSVYTNYPDNNPNEEDAKIELKIYFNGGGYTSVVVTYYEGGEDVWYIYDTGSGPKLYYLYCDEGKTVKKVSFSNVEWWVPGDLWIDCAVVIYE